MSSPTPIAAGVLCCAEDGRIWDGAVLGWPIDHWWRGNESKMLRAVDVTVESADRGFGATYDADLRVLLQSQRRMMAEAGFVRFADGDWRVEA